MDSMVEEGKESSGKEKNEESLETEGENVEEVNEVLIHEEGGGGGSGSPNWFEKSSIIKLLTSSGFCGVNEHSVKERWSEVPVESKKRIEHKYNLVTAKEFELMSLRADLLRDAATALCRDIKD